MKTTFKLGSFSFNVAQEGGMKVDEIITSRDGVPCHEPKGHQEAGKQAQCSIEDIEVTFEAEPGEVMEIYKVVLPELKGIIGMFAAMQQEKNKK